MRFDKHQSKLGLLGAREIPASDFDLVSGYSRDHGKRAFYRRIGKRILDLGFVLLTAPMVLAVLAPLIVLVAMDRSNPFFSQTRVGRGGRSYRMWKLRSMVPDADKMLQAHLDSCPEAREEWDRDQKLKNDPRITKVGRFIRRSSLDELPQFWNVLIGDMSVVGPRPMLENQRHLYPGDDYYKLRPGITGLWQIVARNQSSFADRAYFDTGYNANLSLRADMKILLATVMVVVSGTGH